MNGWVSSYDNYFTSDKRMRSLQNFNIIYITYIDILSYFPNMVQLCAIKFWIVRLSPNKLANPTTTLPFFEWLVLFKCFFIYRRFRIYCRLTGWFHHNSTNKNLPYIILIDMNLILAIRKIFNLFELWKCI